MIVASSIANGATAFIAAGKLAELAIPTFAAAVLLVPADRIWMLAGTLVALCVAAAAWAVVQFVRDGAGRHPSFLGEHDLAALGTFAIVVGLASLFARNGRLTALALTALAGSLAVALGAALASLLGLYLAAGAVVALAAARRELHRKPLLATLAVLVAVTAGTLSLRSGELGSSTPGSARSRTRLGSTRRAGARD